MHSDGSEMKVESASDSKSIRWTSQIHSHGHPTPPHVLLWGKATSVSLQGLCLKFFVLQRWLSLHLSFLSQFCHRLLDAEPCYLDHVSTKQHDPEGDSYWLWYGSKSDNPLLSVSKKKLETCDTLLRLKLRGCPTTSDSTPSLVQGIDSNVGTKLLYQDDYVNIWEFRIAPGERCHFHVHKLRYCFTNLTESITQALDEAGTETDCPNPQTKSKSVYVDRDALGAHAVLNVGTTAFLQFIIEFKFWAIVQAATQFEGDTLNLEPTVCTLTKEICCCSLRRWARQLSFLDALKDTSTLGVVDTSQSASYYFQYLRLSWLGSHWWPIHIDLTAWRVGVNPMHGQL